MKKSILIIAAALVFSASTALAQFQGADGAGQGGFTGPGGSASTVAEAANMPDDTPVTLTGRIEKSLGGDKYQFRDKTGAIVLEIDDDDWRGVTVGPKDVVVVSGDVDHEWNGVHRVDVERIMKQ